MRLNQSVKVLAAASLVAAGAVAVSSTVDAETKGLVTDDIGVVKISKGAPMFIGGYWTLSGPDTALGLDQKRAVEIAFDDAGNKIAGHPVRLIAEDSRCNAEGGQTAATKLGSNQRIVMVLGHDATDGSRHGRPDTNRNVVERVVNVS